jgi:hypothetical protein
MTVITEADREALELAITTERAKSIEDSQHVDDMFARGDTWERVAKYCAYSCQWDALRLKLHEPTPCTISSFYDPDHHDAWNLLKKMETLGISKFHPNPMKAIREAEGMVLRK